jgi:DNA repair protein RecN (Recombination protein N)
VIGEDEELEAAYRKFSNGKKIMEAANGAYAATGDGRENAAELIGRALRELSSVSQYDSKLEEMEQELSEIDNLLSDFNHELSGYLAGEEFDEEQFYETEKRLDLINHLKSKYGSTVAEILEACKNKSERISQLQDYDNYLNQLLTSIKNQEQLLEQLSTELSEIRKEEALRLTGAIREALVDLNFLDVRFSMEFERTPDYTAGGIDDAQFLISTNPGEPEKPLGKVASGGELSRIMLAIKTVMAENDDMDTLIFDEIDSGISGRTAQKVSEKMNLLGRHHQIICITHLPQIAAMADTHFRIEKSVQNQSTVSRIEKLSEAQSIEELARMLGGVEITDTVYQNAKEMKEMAHMKK